MVQKLSGVHIVSQDEIRGVGAQLMFGYLEDLGFTLRNGEPLCGFEKRTEATGICFRKNQYFIAVLICMEEAQAKRCSQKATTNIFMRDDSHFKLGY